MSGIFKAVMSMMIICLGAVIIGGISSANSDAAKARKYHNDVIQEIECGNMSQAVIDRCETQATNNGYTLEVNQLTDTNGKTVMCEVILDYNYSIPILNVLRTHEQRGYAR